MVQLIFDRLFLDVCFCYSNVRYCTTGADLELKITNAYHRVQKRNDVISEKSYDKMYMTFDRSPVVALPIKIHIFYMKKKKKLTLEGF